MVPLGRANAFSVLPESRWASPCELDRQCSASFSAEMPVLADSNCRESTWSSLTKRAKRSLSFSDFMT